jgi:hypothetical protein
MTKWVCHPIILVVLGLSLLVQAQESKRYRGARLDAAATEEARRAAGAAGVWEVSVYTTSDSFDKVYTYYKSVAYEYQVLGKRTRKLPNGQELRDAFFLLDDAKELASSKLWVKIQRPYIGAGLARGSGAADIRDVTAIVQSQRK